MKTEMVLKIEHIKQRGADPTSSEIQELLSRVRDEGIKVPVLVRPRTKKGEYQLVEGRLRLACAKELGHIEIPCVVESY
jgi:ParB/RepB/Spo0J family partition protein